MLASLAPLWLSGTELRGLGRCRLSEACLVCLLIFAKDFGNNTDMDNHKGVLQGHVRWKLKINWLPVACLILRGSDLSVTLCGCTSPSLAD